MKSCFLPDASLEAFQQQLEVLAGDASTQAILVFAADANAWTPAQLNPVLTQLGVDVFGGIFPQIIYEQHNYELGAVLVALEQAPHWSLIQQLSNPDADFDTPLAELADDWDAQPQPATHFVFVDGLATCIATLVESLFVNFGLEHNYLGGGAGSLSFEQKPCLITPEGLQVDAALILRLPQASGVGVAHGWQAISEPYKVTDADKNQVHQLEWQPAFSTYQAEVEPHAGQHFTEQNFFDLAKAYPLGINKLDSEMIVRDPLMRQGEQTLVCVGEVPEGSFVRILNGTPESLIAAAGIAATRAHQAWQANSQKPPEWACFIDCISRVLFLQDQILDEFSAVAGDYPLVGALTLGEIANTGQDYLEFYNKTAVLGLLGQQ